MSLEFSATQRHMRERERDVQLEMTMHANMVGGLVWRQARYQALRLGF